MFKRTEVSAKKICQSVFSICLSAAVLFSAVESFASGPSFEGSVLSSVRGKVRFQKRNTVVPMLDGLVGEALTTTANAFCDSLGCPQSSPYWAVIVDDGSRRYELHQPFAMGATRAPDYVQLNGVYVRPGAEISIEGSIETVSPTYGIISEIVKVALISDHVQSPEAFVESIWGFEGTGWNCVNADNLGYSVGASIWYGRRSVLENEAFHLRVIARRVSQQGNVQGVTDIGNVQMRQLAANIVYQGAIDDTAAALSIRRNAQEIRNYPSTLMIKSAQGATGAAFPIAGSVRMFCSSNFSSSL